MQKHSILFRRPLPPKLPKLPLQKKKAHTAKTIEIELPEVEVTYDETTLVKEVATIIPEVASRSQSLTPINTQNLFLDYDIQEKVTLLKPIPIQRKYLQDVCVQIPDSARGSMFLPSCHSASARVFGKKLSQMETLRTSKKYPSKLKRIYIDRRLKNILILRSKFSKPLSAPCPITTTKVKDIQAECQQKSLKYSSEIPVVDLSTAVVSPLPSVTSPRPEKQLSDRLRRDTPVVLTINEFPGPISMPVPALPRKPQRQSTIENLVAENENVEVVPKQTVTSAPQSFTKTRKRERLEIDGVHGEGFKTISATQYETIMAMTSMAILYCQIFGRNALNLKGFFIFTCPDLTPLAFQLIYLNLSYNDICSFPSEVFCLKNLQILKLRNNPIKEIPSEIQKLKYLRVFNMAFNLVTFLPPGLFTLSYLEELDVSYNDITCIPNGIRKLRSLEKLNVDGNDLTSFPPGILKLNLKKIQFENTYTHPYFWKENSLNSPQRLTHLISFFFLKNNLHKYYEVIPAEIQKLLKCTSHCEWCRGPMFGEGFCIIRSCDVFGVTQFPVMFHVCSSACYGQVKQST
ncbi:leucine-rich repeat-containing protein 63 [Orycteropus afer afer]|uniref:Leucine-rich repeat-containing protein 63 n=1 Tax=Orycteropus afer afer TaxID=1230840 RepID=A0A8B7AIY8_ORYAF|nr:leucine-rich repeat-containing protein 63 [Orycteropus afer afer]